VGLAGVDVLQEERSDEFGTAHEGGRCSVLRRVAGLPRITPSPPSASPRFLSVAKTPILHSTVITHRMFLVEMSRRVTVTPTPMVATDAANPKSRTGRTGRSPLLLPLMDALDVISTSRVMIKGVPGGLAQIETSSSSRSVLKLEFASPSSNLTQGKAPPRSNGSQEAGLLAIQAVLGSSAAAAAPPR
jgi:hypothetical protein